MKEEEVNYTAADFERYYNGSMSPTEMYSLERAALNDHFLADAMDGYAHSTNPGEEIENLRAQIAHSLKQSEPPAPKAYGNMWLRVAATIILTCGIGWLSYKNYSKQTANSSHGSGADNSAPSTITASVGPVRGSKDNDGSIDSVGVSYDSGQDRSLTRNDAPSNSDQFLTPQARTEKMDPSKSETLQPLLSATESHQGASPVKEKTLLLKSKITDEDGNPVSFAKISSANTNDVTVSDKDGKFSLPVADSFITASVAAVGYKSETKLVKVDNASPIVLKKTENSLNEVVVTGNAKNKRSVVEGTGADKQNAVDQQLQGKVAGLQVLKAGEPVGGWLSFEKYISDSMRRDPKTDTFKNAIVILSFKVSKNGEIKRIRVEQTLCDLCDSEAVRLLKAGPKWIYSGATRSATRIKF